MPRDKEKQREANRRFREAHREERAAASRAYYEAHRERVQEQQRVYDITIRKQRRAEARAAKAEALVARAAAMTDEEKAAQVALDEQRAAEVREKTASRNRAWKGAHREQIRAESSAYHAAHVEQERAYRAAYAEDAKARAATWAAAHPERRREIVRKYDAEHGAEKYARKLKRLASDPIFALVERIRNRIRVAFHQAGVSKRRTLHEYGINPHEIMMHLGPRPSPDAEVHHIVPITEGGAWDLTNPVHVLAAFSPFNSRWETEAQHDAIHAENRPVDEVLRLALLGWAEMRLFFAERKTA